MDHKPSDVEVFGLDPDGFYALDLSNGNIVDSTPDGPYLELSAGDAASHIRSRLRQAMNLAPDPHRDELFALLYPEAGQGDEPAPEQEG